MAFGTELLYILVLELGLSDFATLTGDLLPMDTSCNGVFTRFAFDLQIGVFGLVFSSNKINLTIYHVLIKKKCNQGSINLPLIFDAEESFGVFFCSCLSSCCSTTTRDGVLIGMHGTDIFGRAWGVPLLVISSVHSPWLYCKLTQTNKPNSNASC